MASTNDQDATQRRCAPLTGSVCRHECTQGREGQTGSWCVKCGLKIYEVDPRECQHCAHFKDTGFPGDPRSICTKHLMGVTRDMHVTYEITKGSCFSPNNSGQTAGQQENKKK